MPYVRSRTLKRRKGMGALQDLAPDDPILQNPDEGTIYNGPSTSMYPMGPFPLYSTVVANSGDSFTRFLNGNAGKIAIGAGVLFGVILIGKAMR